MYKDIIDEYSIGELAYIDEYEISYPKDIVAMLLKLESRGNIKIDKDVIKIKNRKNTKKSEDYLLDHVVDGKLIMEYTREFEDIIKEELEEHLILSIKESYSGIFMYVYALVFILSILLVSFFDFGFYVYAIFVFFFAVGFIFATIFQNKSRLWYLTKSGKELYIKLNGLKDSKNISLVDDSLIYSIMFGYNEQIVEDYSRIIVINHKGYSKYSAI